ncbi:hypothetical protein DD759_03125 [Helicobacter pylori]|nr:hypothetical protein DD759_03125 [Helicobacter pylori]
MWLNLSKKDKRALHKANANLLKMRSFVGFSYGARMILKYPLSLKKLLLLGYLIRIVWHEQAPVIRIHAQ